MDLLRKFAAPVALGLATAALPACGGDGSGLSIDVVSPAAGDLVAVPFDVVLGASVPLGGTNDELHHAHIWFGDDETAYLVCEAERIRVNHAPDGAQTMHVSLRNSDHTPAGVETSVELTIVGGSR